MAGDVYARLREHLDTFILSAPAAEPILEILRIRFTPEEAEVALMLGASHVEVSDLAGKANLDPEKLRSLLERMTDKALVYKKTYVKDGTSRELYALLPTAVGLWETSFATGERSPRTEQLARLWREYYDSGWGKSMFGGAPFTRVIPVGKSLLPENEILPYEKASDLIKQYDFAIVIHCPCRTSADLAGGGCGKPTEVCFHFGDLARFMADRGYGRQVSQEEVLQILDMTEKAGLIHMVGNAKEMGVAMCSCCTCCCTQLRAIKEMGNANAMACSRFIARLDADTCISCGLCRERCQVEAISPDAAAYVIDDHKCIGCGLCVTTCPVSAINLHERENYQEPYDTGMQLFEAWSKKETNI